MIHTDTSRRQCISIYGQYAPGLWVTLTLFIAMIYSNPFFGIESSNACWTESYTDVMCTKSPFAIFPKFVHTETSLMCCFPRGSIDCGVLPYMLELVQMGSPFNHRTVLRPPCYGKRPS